jgi:chromosomal replication initiator protein
MKEWNEFLSELSQELGPSMVSQWVPKLIRFDAANIYLEPVDSFQVDWFEEHIRPKLKNLVNSNHRPIKVHLIFEKRVKEKREEFQLQFKREPSDLELSLDHFIPGEKNLVAFKLLSEGAPFNPIYIFGPKGSGKTHLLMGAAIDLEKKGKKVFFVNANTFTEHVVQAIRLGQMQAFRKAYREIDALIVDDIHIFSKKNATQEEFFHTFNTLHTQGKPIILSANSAPSQLTQIEQRLTSRFEWGISLEIGHSSLEAILKKKTELWKIQAPQELIQWLITHFSKGPVTALQVLLLRSKGQPLTVPQAEKTLKDLLAKERENALTPEKIVKTVASHYGITQEDILGKSQMRGVATPRQMAMYLCREKLKLPFQKIGEIFGRDHSTVMSSIKLIQKGIDEKTIELIREKFPELST